MAPDAFLRGCQLPAAWAGRLQWCLLDTDFADGLHFLTLWQAWRADPQRSRLLHVVGLVPQPPSPELLKHGVTGQAGLAPLADALIAQCWGLLPGMHRLAFDGGQVLLTLCVGGGIGLLREQAFGADAVHMGADQLTDIAACKAVARLCHHNTTAVNPAPAITDALRGAAAPAASAAAPANLAGRCAVIGSGIAGAAVAASLARRGWRVQVLDTMASLAAGASGLPVGLFAPHVSPDDAVLSRLTRAGIRATLSLATALLQDGVDWRAGGVLERGIKNVRQLPPAWADTQAVEAADWTRPATAAQRSAAGVPDEETALWHTRAGWLRPARLVQALLGQAGITWRGGSAVDRLVHEGEEWLLLDVHGGVLARADLVVVAAGHASAGLLGDALPLQALRGQVSMGALAREDKADRPGTGVPPHPVNGNGSVVVLPDLNGQAQWVVGSTFQRGRTDTAVDPADHGLNLERLASLTPRLAAGAHAALARNQVQGWAGVRATLPDRLPAVGPMDEGEQPGLWVCTGMGARGLTLAPLCAELLAARLHGEPLPLDATLAHALAAERFK